MINIYILNRNLRIIFIHAHRHQTANNSSSVVSMLPRPAHQVHAPCIATISEAQQSSTQRSDLPQATIGYCTGIALAVSGRAGLE